MIVVDLEQKSAPFWKAVMFNLKSLAHIQKYVVTLQPLRKSRVNSWQKGGGQPQSLLHVSIEGQSQGKRSGFTFYVSPQDSTMKFHNEHSK